MGDEPDNQSVHRQLPQKEKSIDDHRASMQKPEVDSAAVTAAPTKEWVKFDDETNSASGTELPGNSDSSANDSSNHLKSQVTMIGF